MNRNMKTFTSCSLSLKSIGPFYAEVTLLSQLKLLVVVHVPLGGEGQQRQRGGEIIKIKQRGKNCYRLKNSEMGGEK